MKHRKKFKLQEGRKEGKERKKKKEGRKRKEGKGKGRKEGRKEGINQKGISDKELQLRKKAQKMSEKERKNNLRGTKAENTRGYWKQQDGNQEEVTVHVF